MRTSSLEQIYRRLCHKQSRFSLCYYFFVKDYFKIIPSAFLILLKDSAVLMQKRQNTGWQDGNYSLVSGHLDGGESVTDALTREVKEEANISVNKKDLKLVHVMSKLSGDQERVDFFFVCENCRGEIKNAEPEKCEELKWFPIDKLPENTIPSVKEAIKNFQKGVFYSEFGWK